MSAHAPAVDPEKVQLARALLDRERRGRQLEEEVRNLQDMLARGDARRGSGGAKGSPRPATGLAARPCRRCFSAAAAGGRSGPSDERLCTCSCSSTTAAAARPATSPGSWRSIKGATCASGSAKDARPQAADAWAAAEAFGADVGLVVEPATVLRDVLNLRPGFGAGPAAAADWRCSSSGHGCGPGRVQPAHVSAAQQGHSGLACPTTSAAGTSYCQQQQHPQLLQAAVEERLRGAYRAMLLQLQHRYATERERQEEAHKLQLQEQTDEHAKSLRELAAAHAAELAVAAKHLEREAAGRRADVQRLEALLSAARASVESSHGQLAAARAATEALQAQLQLQRATHEAELMHVRQVTVPLQQHDEMVAHLRAEWDAALKQRERDYTGLLQQLTELRQQMSSSGASSGGGARGGGSSGGTGPCGGTTGSAGAGGTGSSGDAPGSSVTAAPANGGDNAAGARPAQSGGSSCGENAVGQPPKPPSTQPEAHPGAREAAEAKPVSSAGSIARSPPPRATAAERHPGAHSEGAAGDAGRQPSTMAMLRVAPEHGLASAAGRRDAAPPQETLRPFSSAPVTAAPELNPHRQLQQLRHLRQRRPGPPQPDPEPPSTRAASSPDFLRQQQHPASPGAHSGCSSIDPADDLGTAVFELSEDTRRTAFRTATAAAMAAAAAAAPDVTPQSRGPMERPTSAGSISLGRMERLVDAVMRGPQDSSRQGAGASAGGGGWAAADQRWAEFGGAGAPTPCTGSPEGPNTSDATFGRWQAQQQAGSSPAATKGVGAGPRTARFSPDGVHAGRSGGRPSPRSTLACGAGAGSGGAASAATWGARSGNPAAMVSVLRCLRCGQNDVSSPGECRFHPALLPQPGSLVFSPEWLTCQAAGHTFATAGCLVRPQHFYEPRMLLAAQMQPPPAAAGQVQHGQAPSPARARDAEGLRQGAPAGAAEAAVRSAAGVSGAAASPRTAARPACGAESSRGVAPGSAAGPASGVRPAPATASWAAVAASPPRLAHRRGGPGAGTGRSSPAGPAGGGGGAAQRGLTVRAEVSPRRTGPASGRGTGDAASPSPRPRQWLPAPLPRR